MEQTISKKILLIVVGLIVLANNRLAVAGNLQHKTATILLGSCIDTDNGNDLSCVRYFMGEVYRLAKANKALTSLSIIVRVNRNYVTDEYGNHPKKNLKMGVVHISTDDLKEARKYKSESYFVHGKYNMLQAIYIRILCDGIISGQQLLPFCQ